MKGPTPGLRRRIFDHVMHDLEPPFRTVMAKTGVAVVLGGLASLFVCGQFGLGTSPFAQEVNHSVHHAVGPWLCAAICGALFAAFPVIVLRLSCTTLQFRALSKAGASRTATLWMAGFGSVLIYHGNLSDDWIYLSVWLMTAYLIFKTGTISLSSRFIGWNGSF